MWLENKDFFLHLRIVKMLWEDKKNWNEQEKSFSDSTQTKFKIHFKDLSYCKFILSWCYLAEKPLHFQVAWE